MKKVMFSIAFLAGLAVYGQPVIQPLSSGDYWEIDEYRQRLPELADDNTFPRMISFANGYAGIANVKANRIVGANEIYWTLSGVSNVTDFYVEYSRDMHHFERAGLVHLLRTEPALDYVFRHQFSDKNQVYYRLALVRDGQLLAYTPAVQVMEEENRTKVFPTNIKGNTFYVQAGQPFERLQVFNSVGETVYEKALDNQTGTITVRLPALPTGIYFVRLLSNNVPQHVQRILID